jgi:Major Facilitator Superfamily
LASVRATLKSPRQRRILVAYTVNRLGSWIGLIALSVAVFDHTHSALAVSAMLLAAEALPAFLVPALVARVEASRRGSELSGLYFFEGILTAALAVLLWHFWLPAVLLLAALDGVAALTASALLRAEVARTARAEAEGAARAEVEVRLQAMAAGSPAPRDEDSPAGEERSQLAEREANAALNVGFSATFVLGPVVGGAIVAGASASTALFIDAASFIACGALLLDLHPGVEDAAGESVRARLQAAWSHIKQAPALRGLLLVDALAIVFFTSAGPIEVPFAKATLHAGDRGYGLLMTVWGLGVVIGSIIFARSARRPLTAMLTGATFAIGLAYAGMAAAPSLLTACLVAVIGGAGNGVEVPALISTVQQLTPEKLHGRLMGAVESLGALAIAVGLPLGGALVALSSPRTAFLVVGVGAMLSAVAFLRLSLRSRALEREQPQRGGLVQRSRSGAHQQSPSGEPASR